ncbi:28S ribosomal protein S27, mitochondrial [Anopheles moucheti]|uniref:28S ribosomal protein S27, mitochondrial n=1 Tax=Anopheles moucheti TaxID=186751 RepID=UPI0022F138C3|nr:28S ribosomal protein S27, mitochondrial [Anopheles moucheti]
MWKIFTHHNRYVASGISLARRTFLSDAYQCRDAWNARLTTPILERINLDTLYYDLEQRFQQKQKISAIDIDIYANKLVDDTHIEEVADFLYKFRLTEETSNTLDSTHHALVRNYLDSKCYGQLIEVLNNRIGYGVYLDDFSANLSLDQLIKEKEFRYAARIATLLALQEEFSNPITRALALYSCYRYAKAPDAEHFEDLTPVVPQASEVEGQKKKKKEEIKVRVKFLRNEFFDDHFDLTDSQLLLGKTFVELGRSYGGASNLIGTCCELLGLVMYKKYDQAMAFVKQHEGNELNEEVLQMIRSTLEKESNKEDEKYMVFCEMVDKIEGSMKLSKDSFEKLILEQVNKSVGALEKQEIEAQAKLYTDWCNLRQQRLDEEMNRMQRAKRLKVVEQLAIDMEKEEQKLWFFENEDKIDLQIDSKRVYYPKRWFGKKKKPRTVDVDYVPPEVRQRN